MIPFPTTATCSSRAGVTNHSPTAPPEARGAQYSRAPGRAKPYRISRRPLYGSVQLSRRLEGRMQRYRVGELARLRGVSARTIDFYTSSGLIEPAERSRGGHRLYGEVARRRGPAIGSLRC